MKCRSNLPQNELMKCSNMTNQKKCALCLQRGDCNGRRCWRRNHCSLARPWRRWMNLSTKKHAIAKTMQKNMQAKPRNMAPTGIRTLQLEHRHHLLGFLRIHGHEAVLALENGKPKKNMQTWIMFHP